MNALEITNLTKTYPDFKLDSLNLTLPNGCIMGLIGENGAGKSTTIKLILEMIQKDSGTVNILGKGNWGNLKLTKEDVGVVENNTPENFKIACKKVKTFADDSMKKGIMKAPFITVNSWNEWTETSYLQPDDLYGYGYLEAIKEAFGE